MFHLTRSISRRHVVESSHNLNVMIYLFGSDVALGKVLVVATEPEGAKIKLYNMYINIKINLLTHAV